MAAALSLVGEYARAIELYEGVLAERDGQPEGLAELRPRAEDGRPFGRRRRRLSPRHRARARPRRGLLEPRQPEDRPLRAGRGSRRCASAAGAPRPRATTTACTCTTRSARRWRTPATSRPRSTTTPPAPRIRRGQVDYDADETTAPGRAQPRRCSRAAFFAERAGAGCPAPRSDLHRRPAALRLDPDRADPRQPLGRRRHHGAAGDRLDRARARRREGRVGLSGGLGRALGGPSSPRSASTISSARASSARPASRSSSTRCRTTSCTSA